MMKYCLNVSCASRRGIVSAISAFLADHGCNILDSAQFDDTNTGKFFMRVGFASELDATLETLISEFGAVAEPLDWTGRSTTKPPR